jgi:hypothetical protein
MRDKFSHHIEQKVKLLSGLVGFGFFHHPLLQRRVRVFFRIPGGGQTPTVFRRISDRGQGPTVFFRIPDDDPSPET